jgi:hypothetical protein
LGKDFVKNFQIEANGQELGELDLEDKHGRKSAPRPTAASVPAKTASVNNIRT